MSTNQVANNNGRENIVKNKRDALQIVSDYIIGCGGVLPAGWRARPRWVERKGIDVVHIISIPPKKFKPVRGQPRKKNYTSLKQVALAMGLEPDNGLAARLTAPARAKRNKRVMGANTSSPDPQDTGETLSTQPTVGVENGREAAPRPTMVFNHGVTPALTVPPRAVQTIDAQPNVTALPIVAVAGQPDFAAQLAFASGVHEGPSNSNEEVKWLQQVPKDVADKIATLMHQVNILKDQQSQQGIKEKEMRALQLSQLRMVDHLMNENSALKAAKNSASQGNEDVTCIDKDQGLQS